MNLPLNTIIHGDCIEEMKKMQANSIDSVICDPPYGLNFMGKDWDTFKATHITKSQVVKNLGAGMRQTTAKENLNFMFWTESWAKEALRVIKPGGTMLCFAGTRTQHLVGMGLEMAGWVLKDTLCWLYASGFPKATDISKQIDKQRGVKREVVGKRYDGAGNTRDSSYVKNWEKRGGNPGIFDADSKEIDITLPSSDEAKQWNGWKSHALKPAWEPIIMAVKPNEGSYAENALKYGVAGLNIDGGRIGVEKIGGGTTPDLRDVGHMSKEAIGIDKLSFRQVSNAKGKEYPTHVGRFPANVLLECICDEVKEGKSGKPYSYSGREYKVEGFIKDNKPQAPSNYNDMGGGLIHTNPDCPCHMLDKQSGQRKGWSSQRHNSFNPYGGNALLESRTQREGFYEGFNDMGGASRFFYVAKASRAERNAGCEGLYILRENTPKEDIEEIKHLLLI